MLITNLQRAPLLLIDDAKLHEKIGINHSISSVYKRTKNIHIFSTQKKCVPKSVTFSVRISLFLFPINFTYGVGELSVLIILYKIRKITILFIIVPGFIPFVFGRKSVV